MLSRTYLALLATTLLDHRTDPAATLVRLYHERWEVESAFYALRHTLLDGLVLRSCDPFGIAQELWAQLALYQILRRAMAEAAETTIGVNPDRVSFTVALEAATANAAHKPRLSSAVRRSIALAACSVR